MTISNIQGERTVTRYFLHDPGYQTPQAFSTNMENIMKMYAKVYFIFKKNILIGSGPIITLQEFVNDFTEFMLKGIVYSLGASPTDNLQSHQIDRQSMIDALDFFKSTMESVFKGTVALQFIPMFQQIPSIMSLLQILSPYLNEI